MIPIDLDVVTVESLDGARAIMALDGGHVLSWTPAGETDERLFVSERSTYGPGKAIRGGIPVIFPQFGPFGDLPQHGFARVSRFTAEPIAHDPSRMRLRLRDTDATRALWPFQFDLEIDVHIEARSLALTMTVRNVDMEYADFTAAFHPYFAMRHAYAATVAGLAGGSYRDALRDGAVADEDAPVLAITGPLDRIYFEAPDRLVIHDGERQLIIEKTGFPEAVVWNPGVDGVRSRTDFADGDEQRMLCVEAARIAVPVRLAPGDVWSATQRMTAG
ncbi:MAG: D-hexose-6-phosphate mutarotase [Gemmatimonadaceae bacterium]|nr:D-hexose-6-phosphate mutarotase [Gemmatimonadaceae bacterium]MCC6429641.1 D-hexose-6-phosphate mutarotase [Gemmatimonadaceae bacterium]